MTQKNNTDNYGHYGTHLCGDWYETPPDSEEWHSCPRCGLRPKTWVFDNGEQTACGCGKNKYDHFSIRAEAILAVYRRCNGNIAEYNRDTLRQNWNHYCLTNVFGS